VKPNQDYHVAVTYSNNTVRVFLNGRSGGAVAFTDPLPNIATGRVTIGQSSTGGNFLIDDSAFWRNRVLTAAEITQLRDRALAPNELATNLTWYVPLDGPDGTAVTLSAGGMRDQVGTRHFNTSSGSPLPTYTGEALTYSAAAKAREIRVGTSGKTLFVFLESRLTSQVTAITAINSNPSITVNGGSPIALTSPSLNTSLRPYIIYSLRNTPIAQGDDVRFTAPDNWATTSVGSSGAEADWVVTNSAGEDLVPINTTRKTLRVGINSGVHSYWSVPLPHYTDVMKQCDSWISQTGSINPNGIPVTITGSEFIQVFNGGPQPTTPIGRDIILEWDGPGSARLEANDPNGFLTLVSENLPANNIKKRRSYRVRHTTTATVPGIHIFLRLLSGPISRIAVYMPTDPGLEYDIENPPKFHPHLIRALSNYKCFRLMNLAAASGSNASKKEDFDRPWPTRFAAPKKTWVTAISATYYDDDHEGLGGFLGDTSLSSTAMEFTTSSNHTFVTGQKLSLPNPTLIPLDNDESLDAVAAGSAMCVVTAPNKVAMAFWCTHGRAIRCIASSNHHLTRTSATGLNPGSASFTLAGWMNLASKSANRPMICKGDDWAVFYHQASDRFRFRVRDNGLPFVDGTSHGSPTTATWHFVVAWYDSSTGAISIQVNNGAVDTAAAGAQNLIGADALLVGKHNSLGNMDGQIRLLGVWHRLLTDDERAWLYGDSRGRSYGELGQPANPGTDLKTNLRSYWTFREYSAGTASVNRLDNHGTNHLSDPNRCPTGDRPRVRGTAALNKPIEVAKIGTPPLTDMIELVNELPDCDAWFCMPHVMSDEGADEIITVIARNLAPGRKLYLEYSNECWNFGTSFPQSFYCTSMARVEGLASGHEYYMVRYHNLCTRAQAVFDREGRPNDLVWVVGSLAVHPGLTSILVNFAHSRGYRVDAIAVAPYLNYTVPFGSQTDIDQIMDGFAMGLKHDSFASGSTLDQIMAAHKNTLRSRYPNGVVITYEGGIERIPGQESHTLYWARHPRMRHCYHRFLQMLQDGGVDLYVDFLVSLHDAEWVWSKYNSWNTKDGVGDGSDGLFDNRTTFTYVSGVATENPMQRVELVSPPGFAMKEWNGLLEDRLTAGAIELLRQWPTRLELLGQPPGGGQPPYFFQWYRGEHPGFTPGPTNALADATSLHLMEENLNPSTTHHYVLRATDSSSSPLSADTVFSVATTEPTSRVPMRYVRLAQRGQPPRGSR
jgi:hypothetical protein